MMVIAIVSATDRSWHTYYLSEYNHQLHNPQLLQAYKMNELDINNMNIYLATIWTFN